MVHKDAVNEMTKFIKSELRIAQQVFEKNPNSANWTIVTGKMLAWQQFNQMVKLSRINTSLGELYEQGINDIWHAPMGAWGEKIVDFMIPKA